ncbi:hypothetical protein CBS101457_005633 [Exobasidium rhododendri]|nr:hypothetical protein CBS101457_005633 [Exobasidium rhododendri]
MPFQDDNSSTAVFPGLGMEQALPSSDAESIRKTLSSIIEEGRSSFTSSVSPAVTTQTSRLVTGTKTSSPQSISTSSAVTSTATPTPTVKTGTLLRQDSGISSITTSSTLSASSTSLIHLDSKGTYSLGNGGATLSTAALVGICIGAAVFLLIVICLCIWCCCRRNKRSKAKLEGQRQLQLESATQLPGNRRHHTKQQKYANEEKTNLPSSKARGIGYCQQQQRQQHQGFHKLDSDEGHGREGGDDEYTQVHKVVEGYFVDPTMQTFASYFHSKGADPLPSDYKTRFANQNPLLDGMEEGRQLARGSLPYYKNGRLSTGLGHTSAANNTLVPPLMPAIPIRAASAVAPSPPVCPATVTGKVVAPYSGSPSRKEPPVEASVIRFAGAAEGHKAAVAPLRKAVPSGRRPSASTEKVFRPTPLRNAYRDTQASLYSTESALENHDYGPKRPSTVKPVPPMGRYI